MEVRCTIEVVGADISFPELAEEVEEQSPGGFLRVNDNDSDSNGVEDKDDRPIANDPDIKAVTLSTTMAPADSGAYWTVSWNPDHLAVWWDADKFADFPNGAAMPWPVVGTVYLEGLTPGGGTVTLYVNDGMGLACSDSIYITTVRVKIIWPKKPIDKIEGVFPAGLSASYIDDGHTSRQSNQAVVSGELGSDSEKRLPIVSGVVWPLTLQWDLPSRLGTLSDVTIPSPIHTPPGGRR